MRYVLALLVSLFVITAGAQDAVIPGDLLVMLKPGASPEKVVDDLVRANGKAIGLHVVKEVSRPLRTWLFRFDPKAVPQQRLLATVRGHAGVEEAQLNHQLKERALPNDPLFSQQWHHRTIGSEVAWAVTTGGVTATGDTIVVCIVESANLPHPDLIGNAWYNHQEIPGNGIDDDGNGYVDDYRGWNAELGNDEVYGSGHGTSVAGMIGAKGDNGLQVVGANWNVKMMVVNNLSADDAGVLASYSYPLTMRRLYNSTNGQKGAFVVVTNASWGVNGGRPADAPLWCALFDTLGTAGILNCGATANNNVDVDVVGDLPTNCPSDYLISVTATNNADQRTFSAYGSVSVDVGAPGVGVLTTTLNGGTGNVNGTSFATPLTAGVIALLYSIPCPDLMGLVHADPATAALYIRQALFAGVQQVGNLPGATATGGRIHAGNSVQWLMDRCSGCMMPFGITTEAVDSTAIRLHWRTLGRTPVEVRYRSVGDTAWRTAPSVSADQLLVEGLSGCQAYEFELRTDCGDAQSVFTDALMRTTDGCCTAPFQVLPTRTAVSAIHVDWAPVLAATSYDMRYREEGAATWTELDGLTITAADLSELRTCTSYEFQVRSTCMQGTTDWSASEQHRTADCPQCDSTAFCPSVAADASAEWIKRVAIGGVDVTSGNDHGYADHTGQQAEVYMDGPVPLLLAPGFIASSYPEFFTVWMDLDRDGRFTAPKELVLAPAHGISGLLDTLFTIPAGTEAGTVRMRVIMRYSSPVSSGCADRYDFGETEDYCVLLRHGTMGINGQAVSTARVYPIPANEQVMFNAPVGIGDVWVTDAAGRPVAHTSVRNGHAMLDTSVLAAGTYLYRISGTAGPLLRGTFVVAH
ncbi:MAG: S8 family serine peptidase [Flavobacteriales bacterium]